MQHSHDGELCASLGHYVGGITVAWCPHLGAYTCVVRSGDDQDDTAWRFSRFDFGPFDSLDDVVRHAQAELSRLLRADRAAWAAAREAQG